MNNESNEELIARVYARWRGSGEEDERDILELCTRLEQAVFIPKLPDGMFTGANATITYVGNGDDLRWPTT